ncbi:LamG-like jellyroll fold domain-containing protein [Aporhodopirellula aestuarii]|uniref:FecR domain-containing protein n=1 Tax=Aporhodopirellula aestuarii TaxID=2950107 RepID=A0ABT0U7W8_9BACT|nr:LamG-like jellyroll fold domain-containing protein [Aporhodopirellula aestuarii]MCM2373012.1 FecR domain-containing protein [Aporhodopirellula aestuarii]
MKDQLQELEHLLHDWEAGVLDNEGLGRLREILRTDEAARGHFARLQTFNVALMSEAGSGESISLPLPSGAASDRSAPTTAAPPSVDAAGGERSARVVAFVVGALAASLLVAAFLSAPPFGDDVVESNEGNASSVAIVRKASDVEPSSRGVAIVTQLVGVNSQVDGRELSAGQSLVPGEFRIEQGLVQIEFFCGATILLEGPAELQLVSTELARLRQGKLRAQVPPAAHGFTVEADDLRVVDLGTEFGVSVSTEGADVEVFDGEVEVHHGGSAIRLLGQGDAVMHDRRGELADAIARPNRFVDMASFHQQLSARQVDQLEAWKRWTESFRKDERLIAYYDFNDPERWNRRLPCRTEPANRELDGAIVGAVPAVGRWDGKNSLEFKRPGDRVRVSIPGEFRSLSFSAWVRIDSLDRWYNSLFLTDEYDEGEPHWQILDTGQLYFSVCKRGVKSPLGNQRKVLSPVFWEPSLSGKWLHLATTYDVDRRLTRHYLNGELLHEQEIPADQVATVTRFGPSTIGNWTRPNRPDLDFAIRNLNGSIDELAIFSEPLSAEEIQEIYVHGKP